MALREEDAYQAALSILNRLIDKQVLTLPSSKGGFPDPGAVDAEYIKDLVTGLADFYKTSPLR